MASIVEKSRTCGNPGFIAESLKVPVSINVRFENETVTAISLRETKQSVAESQRILAHLCRFEQPHRHDVQQHRLFGYRPVESAWATCLEMSSVIQSMSIGVSSALIISSLSVIGAHHLVAGFV